MWTRAAVLVWLVVTAGVSSPASESRSPSPLVTFAEHVAPIVFEKCAQCHRPGAPGPFPLLSYADVKRHALTIADVTKRRIMPPWKADRGDVPFAGDLRLTTAQIDTIQNWVAGGMLEGDATRTPRPPGVDSGWPLGTPDLVVSMPEPFVVPAEGADIYRNFVVPLNRSKDTWVRAVDFRPSAGGVVHHSMFYLDATGVARQKDRDDPLPGYGGVMGTGLANGPVSPAELLARARGVAPTPPPSAPSRSSGGSLGGWAPGKIARYLPDDLAFFVPKGSDLILSTHFHSSGKPEREASTMALYLAKQAPLKPFLVIMLPPYGGAFKGINIPAGEARYEISDSFVLPIDVLAFATGAHAHYRGRELTLTATPPGGKAKTLLGISDWDLNWQGNYFFKDYVALPAGTRLDATVRYDNSEANPRNPFSPPRRATYGEQSTDEMGGVTLQVVAAKVGTAQRLHDAIEEHVRQAVLASPMMRGRGGG